MSGDCLDIGWSVVIHFVYGCLENRRGNDAIERHKSLQCSGACATFIQGTCWLSSCILKVLQASVILCTFPLVSRLGHVWVMLSSTRGCCVQTALQLAVE